jgi:hypothetical protein
MKPILSHRALLTVAVSCAAFTVHATDVYSNLDPAPNMYSNVTAYDTGPGTNDQGFQFTTTGGGLLTSIQIAMNDLTDLNPHAFTLSLYADDGSDQLGSLLGSWGAMSTGVLYTSTQSLLVSVPTTGPAVNLTSGTKYWLVASSATQIFWNGANSGAVNHYFGGFYSTGSIPGAFSVQAVPEPASMTALALGAVALLQRRRNHA